MERSLSLPRDETFPLPRVDVRWSLSPRDRVESERSIVGEMGSDVTEELVCELEEEVPLVEFELLALLDDGAVREEDKDRLTELEAARETMWVPAVLC